MQYSNAVAGLDIGGTKVRYVITINNKVVASKEIKTPKEKLGFDNSIKSLLLNLKQRGIKKVGIGIPGLVSGTTLLRAPNLPHLGSINFSSLAPKGMSIKVDNDARCFARSEFASERTKNKSVLALTIGTGVGRAMIQNQNVRVIKRFESPETWEHGYQKLKDGSIATLAVYLGNNIAMLAQTLKPDVIIIGGGTLRKPGIFLAIRRALRENNIHCPIYRSRFHQNSAAIGAAVLGQK